MSDANIGPKVQLIEGGDVLAVASGGQIQLDTGADIKHNGTSLVDELAALNGLDATEVGYIQGQTAGTVIASKAVVVDANKDISEFRNVGLAGTLTFGAGGKIDADSGTATCSSNAATLSKMAGVITSESLTTAAGSGQALTITNTLVAATDIILVTRSGGTSTGGTPIIKAVPGSGSFVITIDNKHASAAFDGTFIISFLLIKA